MNIRLTPLNMGQISIHRLLACGSSILKKTEDVTPNDRRNAKAVNFGVFMGFPDFGPSNPGIAEKKPSAYCILLLATLASRTIWRGKARDKGCVETLFKRREPRYHCNFNVRGFLWSGQLTTHPRSAADLKIAMIHCAGWSSYKHQDASSGTVLCKYQWWTGSD